jgi:Skp family chaperone for outer membrane proteins
MSSRQRRFMPKALAFASLALIAATAHIAFETPSKPPIVATVDLEQLFNGLSEQDTEAKRLDTIASQFEKKIDELRGEVENLQAELENFEEGGEAWIMTSRKAETAISEYKAYEQFARLKIEAERSKSMRNIYTKIKQVVAEFSAAQSPPLDMVLIDDSIPDFEPSDTAGTQRQISARRMLYVNNSYDITEEVLARMNSTTGG